MASRLVSLAEWLKHGHYPDGSKPGAKFTPGDDELEGYYNDYVTAWNAASEALRIAINVQHGLGDFNSGGGGGEEGKPPDVSGKDRHLPSTVPSEVFSPAYERPGLLDWSRFMPTDSRNILGGGYMDPSLLASQRSITAGDGRYYQPWAAGGVAGTGASGLWDYSPPATSLFSPFGQPLNIPPVSYFTLPERGDEPEDEEDDDDNSSDNTDGTGGGDPERGGGGQGGNQDGEYGDTEGTHGHDPNY